ncbi:MAG: hypothetical protein QM489_00955 [Candidatus Izemoplasma sp.]
MANNYTRKNDVQWTTLNLITKGGTQDLRRLLVKVILFEDIFSNAISVEIVLKDSENLPEINPIVGDEFLELSFKSTSKTIDYDYPPIILSMKLQSIENKIVEAGSTKQFYTMTFTSKTGYKNLTKRLSRAYNDTESNIASDILTNILEVPKKEIEGAKWPRRFLVPGWTPFETLNYLAKGAVRASGYPASNFLFWEDRDKHYFKSLDKIMEEGPQIILNNVVTAQREWDTSPNFTMMNISSFHAENSFNDGLNTQNGMWAKEFIGHDIIKKRLTSHEWKYSAEWSGSVQIDGGNEQLRSDYPTDKWIQQDLEPWQEGDPDYNCWKADDYVKRRASMIQQFNNYKYICEMPGDTKIKVGICCQFKLPSHSHRNEGSEDEVLKGNWVITRIRHDINQRNHSMHLELRKPHLKSFGPQKTIENGDQD